LFPHIPLDFCFKPVIHRETDDIKNFTLTLFFHFSVSSVFPVNQFGHSDHIHFFLSLLSIVSFIQKLNVLRLFTMFAKTQADVWNFFLENLILKRILESQNHAQMPNELQSVKCSFITNCFVLLTSVFESLQEKFQRRVIEFRGQNTTCFQLFFLGGFQESPVVM
jgi:hypothetical protein